MIAVERVNGYSRLRHEVNADGSRDPPFGWPCHGVVKFENVSLKYRYINFILNNSGKVINFCTFASGTQAILAAITSKHYIPNIISRENWYRRSHRSRQIIISGRIIKNSSASCWSNQHRYSRHINTFIERIALSNHTCATRLIPILRDDSRKS